MFKIFYIERERFLRTALEQICKRRDDVDLYTLESTDDCFYRLKDLSPDLLFLDVGAIENFESFFETFRTEIKLPIVLTGDINLIDEKNRGLCIGNLAKPLNAETIIDDLKKMWEDSSCG